MRYLIQKGKRLVEKIKKDVIPKMIETLAWIGTALKIGSIPLLVIISAMVLSLVIKWVKPEGINDIPSPGSLLNELWIGVTFMFSSMVATAFLKFKKSFDSMEDGIIKKK